MKCVVFVNIEESWLEAKNRRKFECVDLYFLDFDTYLLDLLLTYYSDKHAALLILFWEIFPPTRLIFHIHRWKKSQHHVYLHSLLIKELRVSSLLKKN